MLGRLPDGDAGDQQGPEGSFMEVSPGWRGEVVVDCLADQGVPEPDPPGFAAADQVRADQGLDGGCRLPGRQVGDRGGDRGPELGAQNTGRANVPLRGGIGGGKPGQQQPPGCLGPGQALISAQMPGGDVWPGQLQQQWVAITGGHHPIGCVAADVAEMVPEQVPGRRIGERGKPLDVG